jgi:hypothetical protein
MRLKLVVGLGLAFYALLSATDWVMTFALLRLHPGAVEANPLAAACLEQYGWDGLALYKTGGVLVFVGAVVLLTRRRPAIAVGVVALGCAALLAVTIYTHGLLCEAHRDAVERAQDVARPKPKPGTNPGTTSSIPDRCWFAPDAPVAQATPTER